MAFLPSPFLLRMLLFTLALVSLISINGCGARSSTSLLKPKLHFAGLHAGGSLRWKMVESRLRGEAQEDMLQTLQELEQALALPSNRDSRTETMGGTPRSSSEGEDEGDEGEEAQERHPADELLELHQADATISYILGGY